MKATITLTVDLPNDAKIFHVADTLRIIVEAFDGRLHKIDWHYPKVERVSRSEPREAETIAQVTP